MRWKRVLFSCMGSKRRKMIRLNKRYVAYAMTAVGASMMNTIFSFYYVKVFLERYHVSEAWFQSVQVVYMIWNALNDPLFGYMQDNINWSFLRSRRHSILYGAPLYAISFIVPWFPWSSSNDGADWLVGVHLLVSLCFFDTLFTFVCLAHCCLFTELSSRPEERVTIFWYQQVGVLLGSPVIFFTEYISENLNNFFNFQVSCVFIAIAACACMCYTGMNAYTDFDLQKEMEMKSTVEAPIDSAEEVSVVRQTIQFVTQASFLSFVLVNFCMQYHGNLLTNFMKIFYDHLYASEHLSSFTRSMFYGTISLMPRILIFVATPLAARWGYYSIMRVAMVLLALTGVLLYMTGPTGTSLTCFFLANSILMTTHSFFHLCMSDVIDADRRTYNRKYPLSSTAYGFNALVTKPAGSFAPMITVAYLNQHGYKTLQSELGGQASALVTHDLSQAMFNVLVCSPIILGTLELILWQFYPIRNSHRILPKYDEFSADI